MSSTVLNRGGWRCALLEGAVFPVLVALLAHGLGVAGGFVIDDIPDIVRHPVVTGQAPWWNVHHYTYLGAPVGESANTMRMLATLLFTVEWRLWGPTPWLFHAAAILCFAALVWRAQVYLRHFVSARLATAGATLFGSLAIHVDAVGMVANSAEVMSLLLAVLALDAAWRERPGLAALAYLAAVHAKESAFLLPAVLAWQLAVYQGVAGLHPRHRRGRAVWLLAACAALFLGTRALLMDLDVSGHIIGPDNPLLEQPLAVRLWIPFVLLGKYLTLTAAPVGLAFDYTYAAIPMTTDLASIHGWLGVAFTVAALAAGARLWPTRNREGSEAVRLFLLGAGAFFLTYALFSNSVFLIVTLFAERLFLAPSLWLVVMALALAGMLLQRELRSGRALRLLLVLVVSMQTGLAALRTWECRGVDSLLAAQVESQPDSVKGQIYLAQHRAGQGRLHEALWHLGIASTGRRSYPGPFRAPRGMDAIPADERLPVLPILMAPDMAPHVFWMHLGAVARELLGSRAAALVRDLARAAQRP